MYLAGCASIGAKAPGAPLLALFEKWPSDSRDHHRWEYEYTRCHLVKDTHPTLTYNS